MESLKKKMVYRLNDIGELLNLLVDYEELEGFTSESSTGLNIELASILINLNLS